MTPAGVESAYGGKAMTLKPLLKHGEVAEWLKAAVSKTVVLLMRDRGFESHPLRFKEPQINTDKHRYD